MRGNKKSGVRKKKFSETNFLLCKWRPENSWKRIFTRFFLRKSIQTKFQRRFQLFSASEYEIFFIKKGVKNSVRLIVSPEPVISWFLLLLWGWNCCKAHKCTLNSKAESSFKFKIWVNECMILPRPVQPAHNLTPAQEPVSENGDKCNKYVI